MKPLPRAVLVLVGASAVVAVPYLVMGVLDVESGRARLDLLVPLLVIAFLLSLRPIRVQTNTELSPSDVAVLTGIVLLPPGAVALLAAGGRLLTDVFTRKKPIQILRNVAATAVATGSGAVMYQVVHGQVATSYDPAAATILAGVVAVVFLVGLDIVQIALLQRALGNMTFDSSAVQWIGRTMRAQFLWSLAAVITLQVVLIEPWFLVPGIPLFVMGYLDIRARFAAERRARPPAG